MGGDGDAGFWPDGGQRAACGGGLLGAAATLRQTIGATLPPEQQGFTDDTAATCRAALGDTAFEAVHATTSADE